MKLGSLFSGIGGIELGLLRSGLVDEVAWAVENDDFCCKILEQNFPDTLVLNKDIEKVNTKYLSKVDILTAGFPCQPVSVAGNQKGVKDERWLWDEVERFINEIRPPIFILENVPNILRASNGDAINRVLKSVAEMRYYRFEWQLISAKFVGARHKRQRWVGVGVVGDPEHYGLLRAEVRGRFGESALSWRSREEEQKKRHGELTRKSENLVNPYNNGQKGRLFETRDKTYAGENEEILGAQSTENIERSSLDGDDRTRPELDGLLPRSRDGGKTTSSESKGMDDLHKKSDRGDGASKENRTQENDGRSLVQTGQHGLQLSEHRGLEQDQAPLNGSEVRQRIDDDRSNRVENERGNGDVADSLDTGQRTSKSQLKRKGTPSSKERGRGSISQPSGQSTSEGKVFNTKSKSSKQTGEQESTVSSEWISWLYFRDGCWGTESGIDWSKTQSGMGNQTHGISRWLAELGQINSWGVDSSWEDQISRVAERKDNDIDRLKALGNGVVPQFMELTGRLIVKSLIEDTLVFDPEITKVNRLP